MILHREPGREKISEQWAQLKNFCSSLQQPPFLGNTLKYLWQDFCRKLSLLSVSCLPENPESPAWLPRPLCLASTHLSFLIFHLCPFTTTLPVGTTCSFTNKPCSSLFPGFCSCNHLCLEHSSTPFFFLTSQLILHFTSQLNHYYIWKNFLSSRNYGLVTPNVSLLA